MGNTGHELLANAQIIDRQAVAFDLTLSGSINDNKLISLGGTPPQIGTTTRAVEPRERDQWPAPDRTASGGRPTGWRTPQTRRVRR